jgi:hypothetical protein
MEKLRNAAEYRQLRVRIDARLAPLLGEIARAEKRSPQQQASYMLEVQLWSLAQEEGVADDRAMHAVRRVAAGLTQREGPYSTGDGDCDMEA